MIAEPLGTPQAGELAAFYSSSADGYKRLWAPELLKLSRTLLSELPLGSARHILDAGTGVGTLLAEIHRLAPDAFAVGVDVAEGMVALGPRELPLCVMDATRLAFHPERFDLGLLAFVLFHLPDPSAGVREMARVLKPGGTVGTITWGDDPSNAAFDNWNEELNAAGAPELTSTIARHDLVDTPEKVTGLLESAGFSAVRVWTGGYVSRPTPDEFLEHRTNHGASRRRFHSLSAEGRGRCINQVRARLESLAPEDLTDRAEVIYAVARVRDWSPRSL